MQLDVVLIVIIVVLAGIAFASGWILNAKTGQNKITSAEERAKKIIEDAEKESQAIKREKLLEVKDEWYKKKQEHDAEFNRKQNKLQNYEKQLNAREENIDRKVDLLNKKEKALQQLEKELAELSKQNKEKQETLNKLLEEENQKLEAEIDSLKRNIPAKIEKIAREKYDMIRPQEKKIKFKAEE